MALIYANIAGNALLAAIMPQYCMQALPLMGSPLSGIVAIIGKNGANMSSLA
jgi:hypothetical protein